MKTLKFFIIAGSLFAGILLATSCQHEPELIPGTADVCFNTDVMLIINSACNIPGCHNGSGEAPSLTTYADVYRYVKPGEPMKSTLYKVINKHPNRFNKMPPKPNAPLNNTQLDLISLWILQGAKDDPNCVSSQ
jgi:hypothetical protein